MKIDKNNQIIIYQSKSGETQIDVKVEKDTVWLTQKQMAKLFKKDVRTINEHILNIFKEQELDKNSVIRKIRTTAADGKKYQSFIYNLDVIISVGYRVKSVEGTRFRIWATKTLRNYLVNGYAINEKKILEQKNKFSSLQETIKFIEKQADNYLLQDKARELLSLIREYSQALSTLKQYDEGKVKIAKKTAPVFNFAHNDCKKLIRNLTIELKAKREVGDLFGVEINNKLKSIIGAINQTFDGVNLYKSIEEKAANLLYLVIKDHPFSDGNKRIAAVFFVYYLQRNNFLYKNYQTKISNSTLASLALLVATSDPKDKELLIKIIISLIQ